MDNIISIHLYSPTSGRHFREIKKNKQLNRYTDRQTQTNSTSIYKVADKVRKCQADNMTI